MISIILLDPDVVNSSSVMDFLIGLKGIKKPPASDPTIEDLIIVLLLCDRL